MTDISEKLQIQINILNVAETPIVDLGFLRKLQREIEELETENKKQAEQIIDLEWREADAYNVCAARCFEIARTKTADEIGKAIAAEFHLPEADQ